MRRPRHQSRHIQSKGELTHALNPTEKRGIGLRGGGIDGTPETICPLFCRVLEDITCNAWCLFCMYTDVYS